MEISIFEIQHEANIHPKQAQKWIDDRGVVLMLSGVWATLHVPFILHSFACIFLHLHSSSFQFVCMSLHFPLNIPFMFLSFVLMSFHFPFIFISRCIHVLSFFSFACMFSHFAFMSFHVLFKVVDMALWLGQGTECNKWLSLSYR